MAILQDVLLQCGQSNDIFKDSDGFNLDISVSIDRDNAVLHVKHFGTEYNKKIYEKKTQIQHFFACSLKLSLKRIISNKIAGIFACCLNDNSTIIIQTLLFFNDIGYFEYMLVIVIKIIQIN